jgi:DNA replication initiation complex subunit (GINS family)
MLEKMVREVLDEMYDGRDNLDAGYGINENEELTPQEKKIADDILNNLNEGFDSFLDKIKSYAKKGLMTAAILGSLLASSQFTQAQQNQIKQTAGIEATMQKGGGIEKMSNQDAYNHVYNMIKKDADGVIKQLQNYKASSQEDKNDVSMILTFINSVKKGSPIKDTEYMGKRFKMASNVLNNLNTNSTAKFAEFY